MDNYPENEFDQTSSPGLPIKPGEDFCTRLRKSLEILNSALNGALQWFGLEILPTNKLVNLLSDYAEDEANTS